MAARDLSPNAAATQLAAALYRIPPADVDFTLVRWGLSRGVTVPLRQLIPPDPNA
jgi:hypothetical protein